MNENNDITRFLDAQAQEWCGYNVALGEITSGRKVSHWIWYIFPQLRGLGHSRMSHYYGIADRKEAEAYLSHHVLGARLREITEALLKHADKPAVRIFGGIDALKVMSCMTLFDCIAPNDIFGDVLDSFYNGERDNKSIV
ncbi:MAG: DUF1810 domain-containing protein [Muribaculaceae bacterium]|nr:DUF1810 domain-containing protein [Muribaculaceae bacterium]